MEPVPRRTSEQGSTAGFLREWCDLERGVCKAVGELKDAMDLTYLTGQRPADVLVMRRDDIEAKGDTTERVYRCVGALA